ncbi:MAG TPA: hypothetical protein VJ508_06595, partial [Saprospiraceae bacterium]|nr:hypothetical protein [Saprospiraceae bacterium]
SQAQVTAAAGNQGLQGGWVISDHGDINFPHSLQSQLPAIQEAGAGWVRVGFRLGKCYSDWTNVGCNGTTALQQYDLVINDALSRGLKILGLINNESWPGGQSLWTANNAENTSGNGDNPYMQALSQNAAVVLAQHYSGIINTWEVWNEPNVGGSTIYPSNFAWLLHHVYEDTRIAGLSGLTFVSGGITSLQDSQNRITSASSGADYLTHTYQQGKAHAEWDTIKATYGSYPLDGIGQHIYIDGFAGTSSRKISTCLTYIRNAYVAFEGTTTTKKSTITEIGWSTSNVSESTQATNLRIAYTQLKQTPYVNKAYWFNIQDVPEASLYFGLQTSDGVHKPS